MIPEMFLWHTADQTRHPESVPLSRLRQTCQNQIQNLDVRFRLATCSPPVRRLHGSYRIQPVIVRKPIAQVEALEGE